MINPTSLEKKAKIIRLHRRKGIKSLGFSIRGGKEHGIGIFVSEIEPGSEADLQGLKIGDEIIRVNGCSLQNSIHKEVLNLFRIHNDLILLVKPMGVIPIKEHQLVKDQDSSPISSSQISSISFPSNSNHKDDDLTWKFVDPMPELKKPLTSLESSPSIGEGVEMKIFVDIKDNSGLGCSICKGPKERPGLFVRTIKDGGLAQQIGLQIGDQIVQVNSLDFSNVEFQDAVKYLKSQQQLEFLIRKGAARDLFPVESSGYDSSSSSINGDIINEDTSKLKLPAVQEELSQERQSTDKILNITTEETEEIIKNETVTEEEEIHETMAENETETIREERKFSETVTEIKRIVTTVDVHQNDNQLEEESDDDVIESIRKVAEDTERRDAELEKERRDAETQTPTSEMSDDDNSAKLFSMKLGNIWKEAASNGHFHPQPPPMPQSESESDKFAFKLPTNKNKNPKLFANKTAEDLQKKQQHDLLIEEFKRVHKLMSDSDENGILPPPQGWESETESKSKFPKTRQITTKTIKSITEETEEYTQVNTVDNSNQVLYIDVGPNSAPGIYSAQKSPQRSSTPTNITDSKYEIPKPPEFFFPRQKPLVTIGTYQNTKQPKRIGFLQNSAGKVVASKNDDNETGQWIRENRFKPTATAETTSEFGSKIRETTNKTVENGCKSNDNFKLTDWNSKYLKFNEIDGKSRNDIVIHNGPKKSTAFIQTNGLNGHDDRGITDLDKNKVKIQVKSNIPAPNQKSKQWPGKTKSYLNSSYDDACPIIIEDLPKENGVLIQDFNPLKLFTQNQIARREVGMYSIPKANAMDIEIEGGYGSQLGGRIIVSNVREGGEIYKQGVINKGDQIMWINGCSMIDITLSQAHGIMREATKHKQEPLKIIVAKAPNGIFDDVSYF